MSALRRNALGRGLDSLISMDDIQTGGSSAINEILLSQISPNPEQPRINFDEELLIIFFSILNYVADTYGFTKEICCQYQLITGKRFETYLNGFGKTRLHQIKYKYFSDKALQLWNLCYAFFEESRKVFVSTDKREYLLVKNFTNQIIDQTAPYYDELRQSLD